MKPLIILITIALIISGCSAASDPSENSTDQPVTVQPEQKPVDHQDGMNQEPETVEPPTPKLYRMNENYIMKPIDDSTESRVVLLTFDDGPKDADLVGRMLDILDAHQAKAIFFVNGYRVEKNPDLLVEIFERGHTIGNHSWDHINLADVSLEEMQNQVSKVQSTVEQLTGTKPVFFRPPHGSGNDQLRQYVKEQGALYMNWSNGSLDWDTNRNNPQGVIDSVMEQLHRGSNILMHELPWTVEALDPLLNRLKEEGYSFIDPNTIEINH